MDPYNLAICFGPTLLPVPSDRDLVLFQGHVNELIKNVIIYQEDIFPYDGGSVYERCIGEVNGYVGILLFKTVVHPDFISGE